MNFTKINLDQWERGKLFSFYMEHMRIVMSLTANMEVTRLLAFCKKHDLKFYPSMIWIVSKVINSHDEFKYGWDNNGNLIRWERVFPSYTEFHKEDEMFAKLVTPFLDDFPEFYANFLENRKKYGNIRAFAENQPPNFFDVSCLPWISYRHFDLHVFDEGTFLAPVVTWGKYETRDGKTEMPLTMNIHHAVADGFHLCRFFREVQEWIDSFCDET